ncbi:ribonuclease HI [Candidatus Peregrinibacteria bacterium]|jgi:ribonuclease HI|nr:ribonuclease HI [Candidatus Peregrinibacteria bacterium]MBT4148717.1 ribonuclease HI [Candidatus Peregrinibacteria bacterium]MBT4456284.1 ribonuclease HI [Candidatus Peregrinibacteria bacterium]
MEPIQIYTDGSCLGNPGPGGWAAIITEDGKDTAISGNDPDTTNNRMEMMAVIESLKYLHKKYGRDKLPAIQINFFIDSNLIVQTLNSGWKKKKNQDLWAEIEKLTAWLNIKWEWVKAHHKDEQNNKVDELAFKEAKKLES